MDIQEAKRQIPALSGLDDDQAFNVIHSEYYPSWDKAYLAKQLNYAPPAAPAPERTWGEAIADTGRGAASGVGGLIKSGGQLYGLATGNMENGATELGDSVQQYWEDGQSDALKTKKANRAAAIEAADGQLNKGWTAFKETVTDPALALDVAASNAATLIPGAAVGRLAGAAKAARGLAAASEFGPASAVARAAIAKSAGDLATKTAIGVGAVQQGADVSGSGYEDAMKKPNEVWAQNPEFMAAFAKTDGSEEALQATKHEFALAASRAAFLPATAVSLAANAIPGANYLERALVGGAAKQTIKEGVKYGLPKAIVKSALGEAGQETLEEGAGKFSANVANQRYVDPNQDLFEGVGENAGMGAAGGFAMGGAGGVFHGSSQSQAKDPLVEAQMLAATKKAQQAEDARARTQSAAATPNSPISRAAMAAEPQQTADPAARLAELEQINAGTPDQVVLGEDGKPVTIPGTPRRYFTLEEKKEYDALKVAVKPAATPVEPVTAPDVAPVASDPSSSVNPETGEIIPAFDAAAELAKYRAETAALQKEEQDRQAYDQYVSEQSAEQAPIPTVKPPSPTKPTTVEDDGEEFTGTINGDLLSDGGKPFTIKLAATRRAQALGPDWEVKNVFDGFVLRKKTSGTTDPVQPSAATGAPVQPTDTTGTVGAGPVADAGSALDTVRPDSVDMGALAGVPGGSADGAVNVKNPQAPAIPAPAQAPGKAPQAVAGNAAATAGLPAAGAGAVEAAGVTPAAVQSELDLAAHEAATSPLNDKAQPTAEQKTAGNYPKGHVNLNGLGVTVENPAGSERSGVDKAGKPWSNTLNHHYGYVKGTLGNDGDHFDLFIKPGTPLDYSGPVFVADQVDPDTGKFDEHKGLVGFSSLDEARAAYQSNYHADWTGLRGVHEMPFESFKSWVKDGAKRKPLGDISPVAQVAQVAQPNVQLPSNLKYVGSHLKDDGITPELHAKIEKSLRERPDTYTVSQSAPDDIRVKLKNGGVFIGNSAGNFSLVGDDGYGWGSTVSKATVQRTLKSWLAEVDSTPPPVSQPTENANGTQAPETVQAEAQGQETPEPAAPTWSLKDPNTGKLVKDAITGKPHAFASEADALKFGDSMNMNRKPANMSNIMPKPVKWVAESNAPKATPAAEPAARPKNWEKSYGSAKTVAEGLGIALRGDDKKFKRLPQLVAEIKAKDAQGQADQATVAAPEPAKVDDQQQEGANPEETAKISELFDKAAAGESDEKFEVHHLFDAPPKAEVVRLADKVKVYHAEHGWMTPAEAKAKIAEWQDHAAKQGANETSRNANAQKVVLSLFDLTGVWSRPWVEAGYNVFQFDFQNSTDYELALSAENAKKGVIGGYNEDGEYDSDLVNTNDVNSFSASFFSDIFGDFDGLDIHAVLAGVPCTDFASSGARHFAVKDADGRTHTSVELVHQTMRVIEYFKPSIWAIENPVGRIERLGGLPPWRLAFDPNQLGDPYTKKTLLWGRFNADLPIAPVEPTEGSKMHSQYGGKSQATKNARSVTPEGFAYSFFMANNAIDNPVLAIAGKYDRLDKGAIEDAVKAGVTGDQIDDAVEDFYYQDLDDDSANEAIRDLTSDAIEAAKPEIRKTAADRADSLAKRPAAVPPDVADLKTYTPGEAKKEWDKLSESRRRSVAARVNINDKYVMASDWDSLEPFDRKLLNQALNEEFFAPMWYVNTKGQQVALGPVIDMPKKTQAQLDNERGAELWDGASQRQKFDSLLFAGIGKDAQQAQYTAWDKFAPEVKTKLLAALAPKADGTPDLKAIESIFDGLQGKGLMRERAEKALAESPLAAQIRNIQDNFLDILEKLDDAGLVNINCK